MATPTTTPPPHTPPPPRPQSQSPSPSPSPSPHPPSAQTQAQALELQTQQQQARYNTLLSYTSLTALLLCPALIALPPRKLDLYTLLLVSGTAWSGDRVLRASTGRGIVERMPGEVGRLVAGRDADVSWSERERRALPLGGARGLGTTTGTTGTGTETETTGTGAVARAVGEMRAAEQVKVAEEEEEEEVMMVGDEEGAAPRRKKKRKADWKAARDAREKEALEEGGKGYGGLIVDQIWEVWNWRQQGAGEEEGESNGEGRKSEERK